MATRRERERREERYAAAGRWAEPLDPGPAGPDEGEAQSRQRPARPSKYGLVSLDDLLRTQAVPELALYGRESTPKQDLRSQLQGFRRYVEMPGGRVRYADGDVANGKSLDPADRPVLMKMLNLARERGIPLAVPCKSRLLRNAAYHAHGNPEAVPTEAEFEALLKLANGVPLVTLNDPDATPPEDEAFLREPTAGVKRRKVGRPRKPRPGDRERRRESLRPRVLELWAAGYSCREVADRVFAEGGISISHKTVWTWVKAHGGAGPKEARGAAAERKG